MKPRPPVIRVLFPVNAPECLWLVFSLCTQFAFDQTHQRLDTHRRSRRNRLLVANMHMMREMRQVREMLGIVPTPDQLLAGMIHPLIAIFLCCRPAGLDNKVLGNFQKIAVDKGQAGAKVPPIL